MPDVDDFDDLSLGAVFTEPPRPPTPEASVSIYNREVVRDEHEWDTIRINLVGAHPLWGHHLWNAARAFATYLDENSELYRGRTVLELGAGGGLPSLVAVKNGASKVVMTDYPDAELIANMELNVRENTPQSLRERVVVQGYIWGHPIHRLIASNPSPAFGLIILSDLVFNHSQHDALLKTCDLALDRHPSSSVLVFFTHHRPHLAHRDMQFFTKASDGGWRCEEILTRKFPPMFPEDSGDEEVRATVHGWKLTRQ
ncbi:putative methyltransferase-domain-containing protein [Infundibulicybe gibba]|nr:putative methyltransferase-domain-containing protein [Infundibulicybe gibba]